MKKTVISLILVFALVFSLAGNAFASFLDYTDVQGHWAQQYLSRAYSDGLLKGVDDSRMAPDEKITQAEILTILCRVLGASKSDGVGALGLSGSEWYAEAAGQAMRLGLISPQTAKLTSEMTRLEAFKLIASAFQISKAEPDYSAAKAYGDFLSLSTEDARIIASMVDDGYVQGNGESLMLYSGVSRAEFLTVLYRVINKIISTSEVQYVSDNAVVYGGLWLSNATINGNIWLNSEANSLVLDGVTASGLTVRADSIGENKISRCKIKRLVLANATGDFTLSPDEESVIDTAVVGDGDGRVVLEGKLGSIEVVGNRRSVVINADTSEILIYGTNNNIVIGDQVDVSKLSIGGCGNCVVLNSNAQELYVSGTGNGIYGDGSAGQLVNSSRSSKVNINCGSVTDKLDPGIQEISLSLSAPESLPVETELQVGAVVSGLENDHICKGSWYFDGNLVRTEDYLVVRNGVISNFTHRFVYSRYMQTSCSLRFVLEYTNEAGEYQQREASTVVNVENYSEEHYMQYEVQNVLNTVTSRYAGDYTTQWALEHDYDQTTKTIWMNAKGYYSNTEYIVWINLTYQRVNIFQGWKGNWTLIHEYLCGTGAPGRGTPVGVYTVWAKSAAGWTTSTYNCRPVVNFKTGSGYAFHSRLYDPSHSYLTDPSIGFPVSHGCIRMYDSDVQWMYNNIPIGTTVVVH